MMFLSLIFLIFFLFGSPFCSLTNELYYVLFRSIFAVFSIFTACFGCVIGWYKCFNVYPKFPWILYTTKNSQAWLGSSGCIPNSNFDDGKQGCCSEESSPSNWAGKFSGTLCTMFLCWFAMILSEAAIPDKINIIVSRKNCQPKITRTHQPQNTGSLSWLSYL